MKCPLCGQVAGRLRHRLGPYAYLTCDSCESTALYPFPTQAEIDVCYQSPDYFEHEDPIQGYEDYRGQRPGLLRTFALRNRILRPHLGPGSRLLEVGCGLGFYAEAVTQEVPELEYLGLDLNPHAVHSTCRLGFQARQGSLEVLGGDRFDVAVMFDVLEHIPQPVEFMDTLARATVPGGKVLIATPDTGSLLSFVSGARWVSYKVPQHVLLYNRRSLAWLLRATGFRLLRCSADLQWVTPAFLWRRVSAVWPWLGALSPLSRGLGRLWLPVPNGNLLALAERC